MPTGYSGGFERALFAYYDSTGAATGQQQTLSNGAASGAYVFANVRTAGLSYTESAELQFEGGDKIAGVMAFGNAKLAAFEMTASDLDTAAVTLFSGSALNTASSIFTKGSINPNRTAQTKGMLILQQRRLREDGEEEYLNIIMPKVTVRIRHGGFGFRAEADTTFAIAPFMSTKAHTGQGFGSGSNNLNLGLENDRADHYFWITPAPIHVMSFRKDGAATSFTTTYRPLSTVVTLNASPNELVINGAITAAGGVNTTTGVITVTAGTAADMCVLTYTTNYVPV
jgi:hypothetical protein